MIKNVGFGLFLSLDYEMGTKDPHTIEGAKSTSVVHSKPRYEESKVPLDEGKTMEMISSSNADDCLENVQATKRESQMERLTWESWWESPRLPDKETGP